MRSAAAIVLIFVLPVSVFAWGEKSHFMINRLALEAGAPKLPEFMEAAREQIILNGPEPDRWRQEVDSPLSIAQDPDHWFNSEEWGPISSIPTDRYQFIKQLVARNVNLEVGYIPYAIIENYGRLVNAFRNWRKAKTPAERETFRANAVYIAGLMGHYVGDGSEPMHLTIHHHGWGATAPNPKNFTKEFGIHGRFESAYVNAAIDISQVRPKVQSPQRLPKVWDAIKQYLTQTFSEVEPLYELEKAGEFNPDKPRAKGTDFIVAELSRAGTFLAALWYTAWLESGEPVPTRNAR